MKSLPNQSESLREWDNRLLTTQDNGKPFPARQYLSMEMNNFANIINRLIHIIGIKAVSDIHLHNPKNLWIINNLHLKDFMNMKQTEIGFEFSFSLDNEVIYLIKKEDEQKEEPPIYIADDICYANSSFLLLIELVKWMSVQCKYVYKTKLFGLNYYTVREMFPELIRVKEFPLYTLRLSKHYDAITFMKDDVSLFFIAKSQIVLDDIFKKLNIINTKEQGVPYKLDVIIGGQLLGNIVTGKVALHSQLINIEINEDDKIHSYINEWIAKLTEKKVSEIKKTISEKIIKATFSQADNITKEEIRTHIQSLYEDLHIDLIDFKCKPLIKISFKSEKLYLDYSVCCYINNNGNVEDYFLE